MATTYVKGRIYKLDVNSLQADPQQPRKYIDPEALRNQIAAEIKKMQNIYLVGHAMGDQV